MADERDDLSDAQSAWLDDLPAERRAEIDALTPERRQEIYEIYTAARDYTIDPALAASLAEVREVLGDGDGTRERARRIRATGDGHFVLGRHLRGVSNDDPDDPPSS